ncbi:MAG: radical SAM protein [Bacilli bacterium]|nr:radical SAM protein [Bacilli bacterium]
MRTVALDFPKSILIETCSLCQGQCIFCPYKDIRRGQKTDYLDEKVIIKLLSEMKNYDVKRISLFNNNEPLMDSRIYKFVKMTSTVLPHVEITLSTNGILLDEKVINRLYENGLTSFYISIPTLNREDYKKIMGFELERVLEQIKKFYNTEQASMLRIAVPKARSYDELAFKNEFRKNGIKVAPWNIEYVESWNLDKEKLDKYFEYGGTAELCDRPMDQAVILANGNMTICCRDWHEEVILGNVKENSIYDIWHSEKYKIIQKLIGSCNYDDISICKGCTMTLQRKQS